MASKLDMNKVYDAMECEFLGAVMVKLSFHEKWIGLVMRCINSILYYVPINGSPQGSFKQTRDIRQGDTLSFYLFILYTEALGSLLDHGESSQLHTGIPIARGKLCINRLFCR